jgi:hypothetical protein
MIGIGGDTAFTIAAATAKESDAPITHKIARRRAAASDRVGAASATTEVDIARN